MKTITLKADDRFDALLTALAKKTHDSKSGVIRAAVLNYKQHLEREALRRKIRGASLKTRAQSERFVEELDAANADGL
ncbi:MAG TPA: ribbon-helix-helix protein, CopG family [Gammaproteobacteria bacterium]|nr:ribbon-helix-helix protein, CopG family [Gammaproteobacteria bacterium]